MTARVNGGAIGQNPFGPQWGSKKASESGSSVFSQVEDSLFGRPRPPLLEPDEEAAQLLARLDVYRRKLARLAGDAEDDYRLQLAAQTIASIDMTGCIFVGRSFLIETAHAVALQVGVIAHEVGHRPRRWASYRETQPLSQKDLDDLCRLEETRADYFAGFGLAHLNLACEPLCTYLHEIQTHPHPEYFVPELRAKTIREGHEVGQRRQSNLQKFFPELARMTSVTHDLGQG